VQPSTTAQKHCKTRTAAGASARCAKELYNLGAAEPRLRQGATAAASAAAHNLCTIRGLVRPSVTRSDGRLRL
jgi:hypothetical protein